MEPTLHRGHGFAPPIPKAPPQEPPADRAGPPGPPVRVRADQIVPTPAEHAMLGTWIHPGVPSVDSKRPLHRLVTTPARSGGAPADPHRFETPARPPRAAHTPAHGRTVKFKREERSEAPRDPPVQLHPAPRELAARSVRVDSGEGLGLPPAPDDAIPPAPPTPPASPTSPVPPPPRTPPPRTPPAALSRRVRSASVGAAVPRQAEVTDILSAGQQRALQAAQGGAAAGRGPLPPGLPDLPAAQALLRSLITDPPPPPSSRSGDEPPSPWATSWDRLCERHAPEHQGAAMRASPLLREPPFTTPGRIAALDELFTLAQEATTGADRAYPLPAGTLDRLFQAYLRGSSFWGRRANPDQMLRMLKALIQTPTDPRQLDAAIRNSYLSTNVRAQLQAHSVYWLGWGMASLLGSRLPSAAHPLLREPVMQLVLLALVIATGGELGSSVVRHGGVGPVSTRDRVQDQDRLIPFDRSWDGYFSLGMAFVPFIAFLAMVTYQIHDEDPVVQAEARAFQRFLWNGVSTTLVALWMANAGHVAGHTDVTWFPEGEIDTPLLRGAIEAHTGSRFWGNLQPLADLARGVTSALWSPQDRQAPWYVQVRSSLPQATTRVRWLIRFSGALTLLAARQLLPRYVRPSDPDTGHYIADGLTGLAWGFVLMSGQRVLTRIEESLRRERAAADTLRETRNEAMREQGRISLAFQTMPTSVAPPARLRHGRH